MKRIVLYVLSFVLAFATFSCDNSDEELNKEKNAGPQVVTLESYRNGFYSAKITGRLNGIAGIALDFECGMEISSDASFSKESTMRINAGVNYSEEIYSVNVGPLESGHKYYYRAYMINQLLIYYGEVKTLSYEWDAPVVETLEVDTIDKHTFRLLGVINNISVLLKDLNIHSEVQFCGVEYSPNEDFNDTSVITSLYPKYENNTIYSDTISFDLTDLEYNQYYYRTFFELGDIKIYGDILNFYYGWDERFLIGSWSATDGYDYTFMEDYSGVSTDSGGRSLNFNWDLDGYELQLRFKGSGQAGKSAYLTFVIESLTSSKMEAYDKNDPDKTIITFRKI